MTASIDPVGEGSAQKAAQVNKLFTAAWPALTLGLRSTVGLTLNLYGGVWLVGGDTPTEIDDVALLLDDASTCYVYIDGSGVVDFDTSPPSGWPGPVTGKTALWEVTTASGAITNTVPWRCMGGGAGGGGGSFTGGTLVTALNEAPITTEASGSTVNIGAEDVNTITISGTTTITAFDTIASGAVRRLVFSGILTLTHNGTSLILPTGANITTAAGDVATFVSLGSGNWRCVHYECASGLPLRVPFRDTYALSDETTDITTGTKLTVPWPYPNSTLTAVYASLSDPSSSGAPQFDINESGSTILSTKITIDATETDSSTAATPPVISDASIAHRAPVSFDIDTAGTDAKGAKITMVGYYTP